jgi:hypothetical protein
MHSGLSAIGIGDAFHAKDAISIKQYWCQPISLWFNQFDAPEPEGYSGFFVPAYCAESELI